MGTTVPEVRPHTPVEAYESGTPVRIFYAGLIGLMFAAIVGVWGVFVGNHLGYSKTTVAHMPSSFLLPFLLLIFGPTLLMRRLMAHRALTAPELLIIFWMGMIASTAPDRAMIRYLLAIITVPHYFASSENQWAEMFFAYLPEWAVLSDARGFYEGLKPGQSIPWSDWTLPVFWWLSFLGAILFTGACLIVILRKQWIEHERLHTRVQPLFLGILVGYVLGVGLYYTVNTLWFADNPYGAELY